ncbi:MauE/DoxX family redox-associated membrane protein [Arachidicoccus ginsenosidimutans]|uniref:MauE/DoxX family redox-associated membrane protein n=1 Tax=Arachidicoccus sp. BS20 TaxID=1850526 RepID=UPI00351141B7
MLITLWAYAALSKLTAYGVFLTALRKQPFPEWSIVPISMVLPFTEIVTAAMLLYSTTVRKGLMLSCILMFLFTLYIILAMARVFGHIPCPCAGVIGLMPWGVHLVFNIVFMTCSFTGLYLHGRVRGCKS